jgi:SAM-dependent methyltransferase
LKFATEQTEFVKAAAFHAPAFKAPVLDPRLADWLKAYPAEVFTERLYQSIELMERYSIELAVDLSRRLSMIDQLSEWHSVDELCRALSVQSCFRFALAWLLERLVETGCVMARHDGDVRSYRLRHAPWQPQLQRLRATGLEIDPANAATLDLLDYVANLYPSVVRGNQRGDQSLFGPQGITLWLNYFDNRNLTYAVNNWTGAVLAADRLLGRSGLRILEIGAGAGSATETLLRWFDQRGLLSGIKRYLFTEPSAFFRRRAQRELSRQYPNLPLEWGALDLNLPWETQGVFPGEFDLIYAVNVLHISSDLLFSLNQARSTLTEGGSLVIGECLRPYINQPIYPELMFQILESFTQVQLDQEIRPNPGFLTVDQWRRAFTRAGFDHVEVAPDIDRIREIYPHFFAGAICGQNTAGKMSNVR